LITNLVSVLVTLLADIFDRKLDFCRHVFRGLTSHGRHLKSRCF